MVTICLCGGFSCASCLSTSAHDTVLRGLGTFDFGKDNFGLEISDGTKFEILVFLPLFSTPTFGVGGVVIAGSCHI